MNEQKRHKVAVWLLRGGLAFVFGYAAISGLIWPEDWIGFLPGFVLDNFPGETMLRLFSFFELGLAAWLLSGVKTRYAAWLSAAALAGVTITSLNVFLVTFRDVGLVTAALALALLSEDS